MGGVVNSAKGFLGLGGGPTVDVQNGNSALDQLNGQNSLYGAGEVSQGLQRGLSDYASGNLSSSDLLGKYFNSTIGEGGGWAGPLRTELSNALATGATTGSRFATEQVQNNPILGQLFGGEGALSRAVGKERELQDQGFELKPEDMTLYGQTSGNIARMFGAQGNQMSQDLASRGLAAAPSGAAGAMFSGLAGNQNEMLAQAQQNIMQQRFQNTMQQIGQQQNFINSLGQQGANAINQQYSRQLSGAQNQRSGLESAASAQNQANAQANQANLGAANFAQENKPQNYMDVAIGSVSQGAGAAGKTGGQKAGASMFGAGGSSSAAAVPPV